MLKKIQVVKKSVLALIMFCGLLLFRVAEAAETVGSIATRISGTFGALQDLVTGGAYLGGMGFFVAAIMKFKQHKDNPTQVTIGTPIAFMFIAAALLFLPTIFGIAGESIFGGGATTGEFGGSS